MADHKQKRGETLSNDILEEVFQELHVSVVNAIDASSVIDKLFAAKVINHAHINNLDHISYPFDKCRRLLSILHNRKHPRAFIELRQAIHDEEIYNWLVEEIDEKYKLLASASAQPNVAQDRSNTSLTSLDDIAEPNLVIDDLRRDVATLKTENSKLVEDNATLETEKGRLVKENARLKDDINRFRLKWSSAEDEKRKMVKTVDELNNKLQIVQISRLVEVFDSTTSGGASQAEEIVDKWKLVNRTNNSEAIIGINSTLCERVGPGVEILDMQPG